MVDTHPQPAYHVGIVALTSPNPDQLTPQLTLLDVKNSLYAHFLVKATFSLTDDQRNFHLGAAYDDPKGQMAAYKTPLLTNALNDMVKIGLLLVLDEEKGIYMLTQPLGTFTQQVTISPYTAHLIAEAFNFFARSTNATDYVANKLAVTDIDINAVMQICFSLRDKLDKMHEIMANNFGPEGGDGEDTPGLGGPGPYGMN